MMADVCSLTLWKHILVQLAAVASFLATVIPFLSFGSCGGLGRTRFALPTQAPFALAVSCDSSEAAEGKTQPYMRWSYPLHLKHL